MLNQDIFRIASKDICPDAEVLDNFLQRLEQGDLTRDENPATHFCVYFLPFDKKASKVFITHHKKSGLWLSPGGHIDKGEGLWQAVNREIEEELGMGNFFKKEPSPFLLTITPIKNDIRPCKTHYDIWYLVETDGSSFNLDPREFFDAKWLSIKEARTIIINKQNFAVLEIIEKNFCESSERRRGLEPPISCLGSKRTAIVLIPRKVF